jgi:hypothetical protein
LAGAETPWPTVIHDGTDELKGGGVNWGDGSLGAIAIVAAAVEGWASAIAMLYSVEVKLLVF